MGFLKKTRMIRIHGYEWERRSDVTVARQSPVRTFDSTGQQHWRDWWPLNRYQWLRLSVTKKKEEMKQIIIIIQKYLCSSRTVSTLWAYTSNPDSATFSTAARSPRKSGVRHSTRIWGLLHDEAFKLHDIVKSLYEDAEKALESQEGMEASTFPSGWRPSWRCARHLHQKYLSRWRQQWLQFKSSWQFLFFTLFVFFLLNVQSDSTVTWTDRVNDEQH